MVGYIDEVKADMLRVFTPVLHGEAKILPYLKVWLSNYHIFTPKRIEKRYYSKKS